MFSTTTHAALVLLGVLGLAAMAFAFRRKQTWPTVFLYVVPLAWSITACDFALGQLAGSFPTWAMDGEPLDWLRFGVGVVLLLVPIELAFQSLLVWYCGAGAQNLQTEDSGSEGISSVDQAAASGIQGQD